MAFSPRPCGCFPVCLDSGRLIFVFPTPVGVFLAGVYKKFPGYGFPHARGGVSVKQKQKHLRFVFPTPVGVFLRPSGRACFRRFPTPVGGVSLPTFLEELADDVFPTPVGVFLPCRLFVCRCQFSPRPWGCFH